eukprot:TRINITY_DN4101_c0_g1_i1.p1 TRINITY_DN4101_c0_g1~~TRINITY_DN4101_c0_g1_i1.p1  ORF type:complete len:458 (-),score=8.27 TRINITY_DN4101_c0_g1_i1:39-1412(-)
MSSAFFRQPVKAIGNAALSTDCTSRLTILREHIRCVTSPVLSRGSLCTNSPIGIQFVDNGPAMLDFSCPSNMSTLLSACTEAPFGHKFETKYDKHVRNALQLTGDQFQLVGVNQEQMSTILAATEQTLFGTQNNILSAEQYCLNVYNEGCFFSPHRDTYRSGTGESKEGCATEGSTRQFVGTLVFELPSLYSGGELVLTHNGLKRQAMVPRSTVAPTQLEWCAFFGDVLHEVQLVTQGNRITVSFHLWRELTTQQTFDVRTPKLVELLKQEATNRSEEDPQYLSFKCSHLYTRDEFRDPKKPNIQKLKGTDAIMAAAGVAAGLSVHVQPWVSYATEGRGEDVSWEEPCNEGYPAQLLPDLPTKKPVEAKWVPFTPETHHQSLWESSSEGEPEHWRDYDFEGVDMSMPGLEDLKCPLGELEQYDSEVWTGNCGLTTQYDMYGHWCLVLGFPGQPKGSS